MREPGRIGQPILPKYHKEGVEVNNRKESRRIANKVKKITKKMTDGYQIQLEKNGRRIIGMAKMKKNSWDVRQLTQCYGNESTKPAIFNQKQKRKNSISEKVQPR